MSDFIVEAIQAAMKASATQAAETVQVANPPDAAAVEKFNEIMATADIRPENQIVQEPQPTRVPFADRISEAFHAAEARQFETYGKLNEIVDKSKTGTLTLTEHPALEEKIRKAIRQTSGGSYLALDPTQVRKLMESIKNTIGDMRKLKLKPVMLVSVDIRRYLRKIIESEYAELPVLSYQELSKEINIQPLGRIS